MKKQMQWLLALQLILASPCTIHADEDSTYVVGRLMGRLGNLLFQVAATSALAWDHGAEPYFPQFAAHADNPDSYYRHHFFR